MFYWLLGQACFTGYWDRHVLLVTGTGMFYWLLGQACFTGY